MQGLYQLNATITHFLEGFQMCIRDSLHCVYEGRLSGLPQRQNMDFGGDETVVSVYLGLALGDVYKRQ